MWGGGFLFKSLQHLFLLTLFSVFAIAIASVHSSVTVVEKGWNCVNLGVWAQRVVGREWSNCPLPGSRPIPPRGGHQESRDSTLRQKAQFKSLGPLQTLGNHPPSSEPQVYCRPSAISHPLEMSSYVIEFLISLEKFCLFWC